MSIFSNSLKSVSSYVWPPATTSKAPPPEAGQSGHRTDVDHVGSKDEPKSTNSAAAHPDAPSPVTNNIPCAPQHAAKPFDMPENAANGALLNKAPERDKAGPSDAPQVKEYILGANCGELSGAKLERMPVEAGLYKLTLKGMTYSITVRPRDRVPDSATGMEMLAETAGQMILTARTVNKKFKSLQCSETQNQSPRLLLDSHPIPVELKDEVAKLLNRLGSDSVLSLAEIEKPTHAPQTQAANDGSRDTESADNPTSQKTAPAKDDDAARSIREEGEKKAEELDAEGQAQTKGQDRASARKHKKAQANAPAS